jgi:hypothetical protein
MEPHVAEFDLPSHFRLQPWRAPLGARFFSLSQKGKVMHIADFMQWFDEGFTMVALYAAPWILTFK